MNKKSNTSVTLGAFMAAALGFTVRDGEKTRLIAAASTAVVLNGEKGRKLFGVGISTPKSKVSFGLTAEEMDKSRTKVWFHLPNEVKGQPIDFRQYLSGFCPEGQWELLLMTKSPVTGKPSTVAIPLGADGRPDENQIRSCRICFAESAMAAARQDPALGLAYDALQAALRLLGGAVSVPPVVGVLTDPTWAAAVRREEEFKARFDRPQGHRSGNLQRRFIAPLKSKLDPETWAAVEAALR